MESITVRVSSKYQIVIPRAVRQTLDLRADDTVLFVISDGTVILRSRPASFTEAMRGLHKDLWPADPDAWLEEERVSWE